MLYKYRKRCFTKCCSSYYYDLFRSFSRNRSSTDKEDFSKRKPARSPTPPAQYRKMVTPSKRPRSPSRSRSRTPTKRKMKRLDSPPRSSRRPPSPPTSSHSDSSDGGSSPSSSSSAPSESPRKRPRYQSPSPRQRTKQGSPARDRRARPRSPLPQSPMSGRAGLKKQQHRSMSPSSSHRSYSPATKRQSPSPRSGRRMSPSNSTKHSQIGMSRSDSGSREHRQRKLQERQGSGKKNKLFVILRALQICDLLSLNVNQNYSISPMQIKVSKIVATPTVKI